MQEHLLPILKSLKQIRAINFLRRVFNASKYYNRRYSQILSWGIHSKEDNNYTYPLTEKNILYLANTVAVVTGKTVQEVMKYLEEAENNHELKQHVIQVTNTSSERFVADPRCDFGKRLGWYSFARITKPKVIIETGVDKGLGGVLLCAALLRNKEEGFEGEYYGTDINPDAGYLISGKYATVGKLLYGDSIESLQKFQKEVDLFINDSDHSSEYEYREYQTIASKLSDHCIILGDNSHVTDKLAKFSYEQSRKFIFFKEEPKNHWYPGGGIGISYK